MNNIIFNISIILVALTLSNVSHAMDQSKFWSIIEHTKQVSQGEQDRQIDALKKELYLLPENELIEFTYIYYEQKDGAYHWDLCAAVKIINGFCSDDTFDYFRDWLIAQGQEAYVGALEDPETLMGIAIPYNTEFEAFRYVMSDVYREKYDKDILSYEEKTLHTEMMGEPWEKGTLNEKYPKLYKWMKSYNSPQ